MANNFPAVAALLLACFVAEVLLRTADDTHLGKQNFLWKTGGWGSCYSPGGCGDGKRERPVWCSEPEGRTVLEFLCDPSTQPPRSKPCFTACRHHRDKLQWQVSAWGACLPVYPSSTSSVSERGLGRDSEQLGVMQRNVSCVLVAHDDMKVHREIDEDNCFTIARKPDPVKFCHIPVPQDCVVGEFSAWTACRGCDVANQTRVRSVIVAPQNGGKACPQLTETRPCNPKVECLTRAQPAGGSDLDKEYKLKVGEWRRCEAPTSMISADALYLSGGSSQSQVENLDDNYTFQPQVGYQTREVSCRDSKGAIVDLNLCLADGRILPARVRPCVVPQDCVVSQWSSWTRIQEGCIAGSGKVKPEIHQRKRDVVKMQQGEGQPCPHLMETRKITERDQLSMCSVKYKWLPSKWSNCVVTSDEPGARLVEVGCGGGVQLRHLTCVTFVGDQPVDPDLCSSLEPLPTVQRYFSSLTSEYDALASLLHIITVL